MMRKIVSMVSMCVAGIVAGASAQAITFNGPIAWLTQRDDSVTVRAQVDTAQLKQKSITMAVELVSGAKKPVVLAKKNFAVKDFAGEFALGQVGKDLVGGKSYLRLTWSIPGTDNEGTLPPVGIVALDKLPAPPVVSVVRVADGADAAAIAGAVQEKDFLEIGSVKAALAWNKDGLHAVVEKPEGAATVRFSFDGKNGKNAFLSFADRVALYDAAKDSLWGLHYAREMIKDTINYAERLWPNEMSKSAVDGKVVIDIPWYDLGVIPFEERVMGAAITVVDDSGKMVAAVPEGADFHLPGTWADLKLGK